MFALDCSWLTEHFKNTKFKAIGPCLAILDFENLKFIYFEILADFKPHLTVKWSQKAAMATANSFFSFSSPSCMRK